MIKILTICAVTILSLATPAYADEHDDWAKNNYSENCWLAGELYKTTIEAKRVGMSKAAIESLARRIDNPLHQVIAIDAIEKIYSDNRWDKISPEIAQIVVRSQCKRNGG